MENSSKPALSRRQFLQSSTALTAGTLAALHGSPGLASRRSKQPNVLYIFSDQHRAEAMGCYGNSHVRTPALDAFAEQGARLDAAMSSTPVCCPHRASLMTGMYAHHHRVMSNSCLLEAPLPCLGETFRDAGYVTGYAGKWHINEQHLGPERTRLGFPPPETEKRKKSRPHHMWVDIATPDGGTVEEEVYKPTHMADAAIDFIREKSPGDKPWLFMLSWVPPHSPYVAPDDLASHYTDVPLPPNVPEGQPTEHARNALPEYYGMVESLDREFARVMKALDDAGVAEDTIVVYSSDHGDMLGSHGYPKKRWPHDASARVPFLIRYPRAIPAGQVISDPLGTPDVYPTLAALAGVAAPDGLDGVDYSPLLRGETEDAPRDYTFLQMAYGYVAWPGWRSLRTRQYNYARTVDGPWLLYDVHADPWERNNLVDDPAHQDVVAALDQRLAEVMRASGDSWEASVDNGDLKNWVPGGPKTRSNDLGVDWPSKVAATKGRRGK